MQWSRSLLVIVLIGFVTVEGTWKPHKEYNYKVHTKALAASKDETWKGAMFHTRLTIRPQSDKLLIGRLSQSQYAQVQQSSQRADSAMNGLQFNDMEMAHPFTIELENGRVKALHVDPSLTDVQIGALRFVVKAVMNQFHVDKDAQGKIDENTAAFVVDESTMFGDCETSYKITSLPQYLAQSSRDLVPLPQEQNEVQYMDVFKSRDYSKCMQSITERVPTFTEVIRTIVSGSSLDDYTVQSSFATMKTADRSSLKPETITHVNVTLEPFEDHVPWYFWADLMDLERDYPPNAPDKNNENHGWFEHVRGDIHNLRERVEKRFFGNPRARGNVGINYPDLDGVSKWSGCWTGFPSADSICVGEFDAQYVAIESDKCGFLGLGKQEKCQLQYPECKATGCTSFFVKDLCDQFNGELPKERGTLNNCSPGFWRFRCCSN